MLQCCQSSVDDLSLELVGRHHFPEMKQSPQAHKVYSIWILAETHVVHETPVIEVGKSKVIIQSLSLDRTGISGRDPSRQWWLYLSSLVRGPKLVAESFIPLDYHLYDLHLRVY